MLRLRGWGLRPWLDFEFDPSSGRCLKQPLKSEPTSIIDTTYDDLDCELANLPAMLPSWSERKKAELVAEWSAHMAKGAAGAIL